MPDRRDASEIIAETRTIVDAFMIRLDELDAVADEMKRAARGEDE